MKFKNAVAIGLLAVSGSLVPAVAMAVDNNINQSPAKIDITQLSSDHTVSKAGDGTSYVQKQVNELLSGFGIDTIASSTDKPVYVGVNNDIDKKQLDFMRGIYKSQDMSALFKDSPKKDNIIFAIKNDSLPFMFSFDNVCLVNVPLDKSGMPVKLNFPSFGDASLDKALLINDSDELYNEMVVRHEIAHCRFSDYAAPLQLSRDSKLNKFINDIVRDSAPVVGESPTQMLNESFVDSLAAIQMLVKYGVDNPDVNLLFNKVQVNREAFSFQQESLGKSASNVYSAHTSLKLLLTDEYKDKLRGLNADNAQEMEPIALEVGNKALVYSLSHSKKEDVKALFNMENLKTSTSDAIAYEIFKEHSNEFKRGVYSGALVSSRMAYPDNQLREIAKSEITKMKQNGTFDAYKDALVTMSFKMFDKDNGFELGSEFLKKRNESVKLIESHREGLEPVLNDEVKKKYGFDLKQGLTQIHDEISSYNFKSPLENKTLEQVLGISATESSNNIKKYVLPTNIAEKMQMIEFSINQQNQDNRSKIKRKFD